ncbi:hypothetical protein P153DRAFT_336425 [Dothidotthia symphoricarpi CBS 119687]|uniref:ORC6 first cyclin-like domain-containing protein n=1 Tax=Dothidotthia symphoricarpi CBS 119687 TaxID=1392245 RepID=A0A6A6AIL1_9PLEO|nr:uncharacterized protein P153DRAFT_336425 [Dothidotthia symphoricarpi CBS 119687]KAF2131802.1 hypothetical protein P153DRAFT_336425 [Dothidotthia symphoricarpi CBS 119687]
MSRAAIEQALTGLVPTLNGPLPPELVELAFSLLTRSATNSFKSDEAIARPYACAQLACERLKKRLNLPAIVSRPPCPPRIYKKLYSYLNSTLPAPSTNREPQTPRKAVASAPPSAHNTPKTSTSAKKTPRTTRKEGDKAGELPGWTMSTIRSLAKSLDHPNAAPHIFTGVESIIPLLARMSAAVVGTPTKRPRKVTTTSQPPTSPVSDTRIIALIATVFLYVLARMSDQEVTPDQYQKWQEDTLNTLLELPSGQNITYEELSPEVIQLRDMAPGEGWLHMEWFLNIAPSHDVDAMEGVEATDGNAHSLKENRKRPRDGASSYIGLGTMMQDATDYLGERQREDYKRWKANVMARVQEIEAA